MNGKEYDAVFDCLSIGTYSCTLWAKKGLEYALSEVEGVHSVVEYGNKYFLSFDHRYNMLIVIDTIIRTVLPEHTFVNLTSAH